jgi:radical SAM superfamily enzyme YgiQ (UPF0313 family)
MKIILAVPAVAKGTSFVGASLPPLGVCRIATVVNNRFPDIDVEVWDGVLLGQKELLRRTKMLTPGSILGLSAHTSLNWTNCLELAHSAPSSVQIVIGGIHADYSRCGEPIVRRLDYDVIQGRAENSFCEYIDFLKGNRPKHSVSNLIYLENGAVRQNPVVIPSQVALPFPDYRRYLSLNDYAKNFHSNFLTGDIGFTMISPEGCKWQAMGSRKSQYCVFCDIGTKFSLHEPKFFSDWILDHVRNYSDFGRIFMVDYADEATGAGLKWWRAVKDQMPQELKPHENFGVKVYTKSGPGFLCSDEMAQALWDVGVEDIHVGFEAATDSDLKSLQKGSTRKDHEQLVRIAKKFNFRIIAAFVLGAPTATKDSLQECIRFVDWMKGEVGEKVAVVAGSPLFPLPGAPAWNMIKEKAFDKGVKLDLFSNDNPDLYRARELWYEWFCPKLCEECGGPVEAIEYAKSIGKILAKMGSLPTPENEFG